MNIALRKVMTVDDYLDWAAAQSEQPRTELINGQIVAMSPERAAHNRTKLRIAIALQRAIEAAHLDCEVFTDGLTVPIDAYTSYEPDASVRCGTPLPSDTMKITDPVIVVEVVSPSSVHSDTSAKLIGYFKVNSVRHYLVIDPDTRRVTHHSRAADGQIFANTLSDGTLRLDPPGISVEVEALFG
jgi:Uma2 family endonuclease